MTSAHNIVTSTTDSSALHLNEEAANLCFEQIVTLLDKDHWRGGTLARVLPNLIRHLPDSNIAIQRQWTEALNREWQHVLLQVRNCAQDIAFLLGILAGRMQEWRRAITCFTLSLEIHGRHHATLYNLAIVHGQFAEYAKAQRYLRDAIRCAPANPNYVHQFNVLRAWRQSCRIHLGNDSLSAYHHPDPVIHATLLAPQHALALLHQQSDPDIVRFARLQPLDDVSAAAAWIRGQNDIPGQLTLALIHPEYGLVGVTAMAQQETAAVFYYWIGRSYQGYGYGRAALYLLQRVAFHRGVRYLFSSVFEDNARSIALLQRAGYRRLQNVREALEVRMPFYFRAFEGESASDDSLLTSSLQQLLMAVDGDSVLSISAASAT